ncbi:hypothetical protein WJX84_012372 [Apatococcus fuscideae]|uniref:Extradiol ring-cleavage dioxygenase class III enzyme subunit B domain-containing protein n=1 Tax=Apatococcus fuscideae TaxID=2026836 RepID=A0AAW1T146_9CHLO
MSVCPFPALYLTHGGGPLPLLSHKPHAHLAAWADATLCTVAASSVNSSCVCTLGGAICLRLKLPPPRNDIRLLWLAQRVSELLGAAGVKHQQEARGFDHAAFVPLKLAYPAAEIPVVSLSLLSSMDPQAHIDVGKALAPLRSEGVLIIGSGSSYHNLRDMLGGGMSMVAPEDVKQQIKVFNTDLRAALTDGRHNPEQREQRLAHWEQLAGARRCHPREEHLLPLMVAFGAGGCSAAEVIYDGAIGDYEVLSFQFG